MNGADLKRWMGDNAFASNAELADALGVNASTVTRWLNDARGIDGVTKVALAHLAHDKGARRRRDRTHATAAG